MKDDGLIKFRVRVTRLVSKDFEVMATDMYKAQQIGRGLADHHDWGDFDNLSYSVQAEPWFVQAPKRRK